MRGGDRPTILLTGRPGCGKSTVMQRLAARLRDHELAGFDTQEIRHDGQRQGFLARTFSDDSCVLASVNLRSRYRVGRYGVDVAAFEALVLPELTRPCDVMLIDEIGKMECFSTRFADAVRALLDGPIPIVATIAMSGRGFIAEVKARADVELWEVTPVNRDALPQQLAARLATDANG